MGWKLSDSLKYKHAEDALRQAIVTAGCPLTGLIHHSDRGFQYTYTDYMALLAEHGIQMSRTEHGDPLENAVAERINGILKQEWLSVYTFDNEEEVRRVLTGAIEFYNKERPHASNNWLTPEQAMSRKAPLKESGRITIRAQRSPLEFIPNPRRSSGVVLHSLVAGAFPGR